MTRTPIWSVICVERVGVERAVALGAVGLGRERRDALRAAGDAEVVDAGVVEEHLDERDVGLGGGGQLRLACGVGAYGLAHRLRPGPALGVAHTHARSLPDARRPPRARATCLTGERSRRGYRRTTMTTRTHHPRTTAREHPRASPRLAVALALGLAACSDDDGGDDTATDPDARAARPRRRRTTSTPVPERAGARRGHGRDDRGRSAPPASPRPRWCTRPRSAGRPRRSPSCSTPTRRSPTSSASSTRPSPHRSVRRSAPSPGWRPTRRRTPRRWPWAATRRASVAIDAGEAGFEVVPKLPKSTVQCLAPMTYVVVFTVPDA